MDIGKIFDSIGGDKAKDALEVITKNKDRLDDISKLMSEHRDTLWNIVTSLPKLLSNVGESIEAAGKGALATGQTLVGEDAKSGAAALLDQGAATLTACVDQLTSINKGALGAAKQLTKVPLVSGAAKELAESVTGFGKITEQLAALSGNLGELAEKMRSAGSQLSEVGKQLNNSGGTLKKFTPGS